MTALPYFKLYPADFMGSGKVQMMNATAFGIYQALLNYSWQEGPIPDNPNLLWRVSKADSLEQFEEFWPVVRPCWRKTPEGLVNDRLEKERADALDRRRKAIKAARARHDDTNAPANAHADAVRMQSTSNANGGARGDARAMPSHSSESHSTEIQSTEAQNSSTTTAREPDFALQGLYGWRGSEGTDPVLLKAFPEDHEIRDRCLLIAMQRLEVEGKDPRANQRVFRRVLDTVIEQQSANGDGLDDDWHWRDE